MKLRFLIVSLLLQSCSHSVFATEDVFHKVSVNPLEATLKQFIADGQRIAILFQNDSDAAASNIDVFPEPPVTIRNKKKNTSCEISEGGIWVREEVYLTADEHYVLMNEYSGSGSDLVSYDTRTCLETKRLDVSGMRWRLDGSKMYFDKSCCEHDMSNCTSLKSIDLIMFTGKTDMPEN